MPNPSLEPRRYGSQALATPGLSSHCPSAAKPWLPERAVVKVGPMRLALGSIESSILVFDQDGFCIALQGR